MTSDWKQIGCGEPNDPIIGDPSMHGRRWKISYDSPKAYPKITKPTKLSKSLTYDKFYETIKSIVKEVITESKSKEKHRPTSDEYKQLKQKFGKYGVGWAKDKKGIYCYTHRARSDSYKSIDKISEKQVKFIDSTG